MLSSLWAFSRSLDRRLHDFTMNRRHLNSRIYKKKSYELYRKALLLFRHQIHFFICGLASFILANNQTSISAQIARSFSFSLVWCFFYFCHLIIYSTAQKTKNSCGTHVVCRVAPMMGKTWYLTTRKSCAKNLQERVRNWEWVEKFYCVNLIKNKHLVWERWNVRKVSRRGVNSIIHIYSATSRSRSSAELEQCVDG